MTASPAPSRPHPGARSWNSWLSSFGIFSHAGMLGIDAAAEEAASADFLILPTHVSGAHCISIACKRHPQLIADPEDTPSRRKEHPKSGSMHGAGAPSRFREAQPQYIALAATLVIVFQRSSRTEIAQARWFDRIIRFRNAAPWQQIQRNSDQDKR